METLAFVHAAVGYESPNPEPTLRSFQNMLPSSTVVGAVGASLVLSGLVMGSSAEAVVGVGSKGQAVTNVQSALRNFGIITAVDGSYGSQTQAAVREFQRQRGLTADGVVGPRTAIALGIATSSTLGPYAVGGGGGGGTTSPGGAISPNTVTITASRLRIRALATSNSAQVGSLSRGQQVQIDRSQQSNGFVKLAGREGWIALTYTSATGTGTGGGGVVTGSSAIVRTSGGRLNVRNQPSSTATVVDRVANGATISITGRQSGGWYELTRGGWASGQFLRVQ
ncbi:MAG: SH3 domain-containing protein [Leptolyngbyaceae cyanobacterium bins.59]|nr:SH3 domain-containing protein [Leptolyngbyaceae cyanobacterium bins.59]